MYVCVTLRCRYRYRASHFSRSRANSQTSIRSHLCEYNAKITEGGGLQLDFIFKRWDWFYLLFYTHDAQSTVVSSLNSFYNWNDTSVFNSCFTPMAGVRPKLIARGLLDVSQQCGGLRCFMRQLYSALNPAMRYNARHTRYEVTLIIMNLETWRTIPL